MKKIGVLVGSLRKESYTKKIAEHTVGLFSDHYDVEFINIGELPIYNQDYDDHANVPDKIAAFREKAKSMDAFLFVTPEYNRSVPGGLKNALDVGSRPIKESVWANKTAAIISVSPGRLSAFGANHHLRQSLVFFNMPVVQQPEMYVGNAANLLDADGNLTDKNIEELLQKFINAFEDLISLHDSVNR